MICQLVELALSIPFSDHHARNTSNCVKVLNCAFWCISKRTDTKQIAFCVLAMVEIRSVMVQIQFVMGQIQFVMGQNQSVMVEIQSVMEQIQFVMEQIWSVMVEIQR